MKAVARVVVLHPRTEAAREVRRLQGDVRQGAAGPDARGEGREKKKRAVYPTRRTGTRRGCRLPVRRTDSPRGDCNMFRTLFTAALVGAALLAGPVAHAADPAADPCVKACKECAKACEVCAKDEKDPAEVRKACETCRKMCLVCAELLESKSDLCDEACKLCAKVSEACAKVCEKHDDEDCKKAAKACRKCAAEAKKHAK